MAILAPHKLPVFVYTNGALLRLFTHGEVMGWGIDTIVVSVSQLMALTPPRTKRSRSVATTMT
jgi:hypothetical protein